jgi:hypothetical protein
MKGDNMDPWILSEVNHAIDGLKNQYPNAEITGARMDDYVPGLLKYKEKLPVITEEFGDTWIPGYFQKSIMPLMV